MRHGSASRPRLGLPYGLLLLVRQRVGRPPGPYRLGVHATLRPVEEPVEERPIPMRVEHGKGEALVPAGVVEGVVPDDPDTLKVAVDGGRQGTEPAVDLAQAATGHLAPLRHPLAD